MYKLNPEALKAYLNNNNLEIKFYKEIDSTNNEAKKIFNEKPLLIIANKQTAGRGRQGHSFFSPNGLYFSYVLPFKEYPLLTLSVGIAIAQAFRKQGISIKLKWVNDIIYKDRKLGGILCEHHQDALIIGVGLNIYPTVFPEALKDKAISLDKTIDSNLLLVAIINELYILFNMTPQQLIELWKEANWTLNKEIQFTYNNEILSGKAIDIALNGSLIIATTKGLINLDSGEIL